MIKNSKTNKNSIRNKTDKYSKHKIKKRNEEKAHLIKGTLIKNKKGFGFITREDCDDVFVAARNMEGAMNGDYVEVKIKKSQHKLNSFEGYIVNVLERKNTSIVGKLKRKNGLYLVNSLSNPKLEAVCISGKNLRNAKLGDIVVAKIIRYPKNGRLAEAKVKEVVAHGDTVNAYVKGVSREYGINDSFSQNIIDEADYVSKRIRIRPNQKRIDFRKLTTVTIDGSDSKDFDDAISVTKNENGNYILYVHIADVAEYVRMNTELDKEAFNRGNSVYLPDRVIPMLPPKLSNGVCSLNPLEDRLALTCIMEINDSGDVVDYKLTESVIRSNAHLIYDDVSDILEKNDKYLKNKYKNIFNMIMLMKDLFEILNKKRLKEGSLDFDLSESKVILNNAGYPEKIENVERRTANKIIEEFMLLTNKTVAEHFFYKKIPFVYRVHEKPDMAKMNEFKEFLSMWGIKLNSVTDAIKPKELSDVLNYVSGKPNEKIISMVMIRTMKKARYDTECLGHYGLAFKYYCHFTSPIRRYADLLVHRSIKEDLHNGEYIDKSSKLKSMLEKACEHISETERNSMDLERKVIKYYQTIYMSDYIGNEYNGIISGVKGNGIYVELDNSIEGFIDFESMHDFYTVDEKAYQAINNRNGQTLTLGESVKIIVYDVNVESGYIDFRFAEKK